MTEPTTAPGADVVRRAVSVVDLGLQASHAYGREDLAQRLQPVRRSLDDPGIHVVVAGEFKKGKSSLVNALVGAAVCPVDDDTATAVPTYIRYGEQVQAYLLYPEDPVRREPVAVDEIRRHVTQENSPSAAYVSGLAGVEVRLPRTMLASGLVIVDTPGVGGLGSAHAAASLAAISMADAVVFVTDASQELTAAEVDFLRQARDLCSTVVCALSKTDFFPAWRQIRDLDTAHLRRVAEIPVIPVSSTLRARAVRVNDAALNHESGFPALVEFVSQRVAGGGVVRVATSAAAEVVAVARQIESQFQAELAALSDPETSAKVVAQLTATKERAELLRVAAAKWQQTLGDGIADLTVNVDHDLRARIRQVIAEADKAIEEADPADTWPQVEAWLKSRMAQEMLTNYTLLRRRAGELSELVAEHFRDASGVVLAELGIYNPSTVLGQATVDTELELERQGMVTQAWSMMRQSYGGILMFTVLPAMLLHITVAAPVAIGIGLVMGRKGLVDEKKRHLQMRRGQAKNAVRKYCDEVTFAIGKDSRDTVRRVQRQLRDFYATRAEELNRSNAEALKAAQEVAQKTEVERQKRVRDLQAELARLKELRERAAAVRG
ncbi:MAG TPA: dynamin family protein [Kineosporiaceae bacterium]